VCVCVCYLYVVCEFVCGSCVRMWVFVGVCVCESVFMCVCVSVWEWGFYVVCV